ncbi:hypothetical protein Tco_1475439 [Tanacetum coccineum]
MICIARSIRSPRSLAATGRCTPSAATADHHPHIAAAVTTPTPSPSLTTTQPSPPTSHDRHHQHIRHPFAASTTTDAPTPPPPTSPSRHHITTTTTSPHQKGASGIIPARVRLVLIKYIKGAFDVYKLP